MQVTNDAKQTQMAQWLQQAQRQPRAQDPEEATEPPAEKAREASGNGGERTESQPLQRSMAGRILDLVA